MSGFIFGEGNSYGNRNLFKKLVPCNRMQFSFFKLSRHSGTKHLGIAMSFLRKHTWTHSEKKPNQTKIGMSQGMNNTTFYVLSVFSLPLVFSNTGLKAWGGEYQKRAERLAAACPPVPSMPKRPFAEKFLWLFTLLQSVVLCCFTLLKYNTEYALLFLSANGC